MGLNRRYVPPFSASAWRLLLAAGLTSLLLALAYAGLFVTTAPAIVSLLIQPFSLLLMPGFIAASLAAGRHDFSPQMIILTSVPFYFVFFYAILGRRLTRAHNRSR